MMKSSMARAATAASRYANFNVVVLRGGRSSAASRIITMAMGSSASTTSYLRQVHQLHSSSSHTVAKRTFATAKQTIPGQDPLILFQQNALKRKLCDDDGYRLPDVHWVFSVAIDGTDDDTSESLSLAPPNLRAVGLQRVSNKGIDFVMKRNGTIEKMMLGDTPKPISMLYMQGKYKPGEIVTQWRGEGICESLPLTDEFVAKIPLYTLTGMVASKRMEEENLDDTTADHKTDSHRTMMELKSHFTQVTQQTRMEIESNKIAFEELDESIRLLRFRPTRMEYMEGGPSEILWNRWEWLRTEQNSDDEWSKPKQLLPH